MRAGVNGILPPTFKSEQQDSKAGFTGSQEESKALFTGSLNLMQQTNTRYGRLKDAFGGLSDKKLGDELGVTKQAVSQWKRGITEPGEAVLIIAAEKTELPYKWLLTGDKKYLPSESNKNLNADEKMPAQAMTFESFKAELRALGVEDVNPLKSFEGLTPADMDEILAVARSTVKTMVEQKIKARNK
jgi:transcriptional regulator with XRE-family HTH domain